MFGLGKAKACVGLDIGSSAVKAVELKAAGKGFKVAAFGTEPVPPDSIVDGAIIDATAVTDAIKRLFENKAFKTKEVAASLSGNAVIVKKISLPVLVVHSEDDQIVPYADAGPKSAALLKNGVLKTYKDLPHGLPTTHADVLNADLLEFFQS